MLRRLAFSVFPLTYNVLSTKISYCQEIKSSYATLIENQKNIINSLRTLQRIEREQHYKSLSEKEIELYNMYLAGKDGYLENIPINQRTKNVCISALKRHIYRCKDNIPKNVMDEFDKKEITNIFIDQINNGYPEAVWQMDVFGNKIDRTEVFTNALKRDIQVLNGITEEDYNKLSLETKQYCKNEVIEYYKKYRLAVWQVRKFVPYEAYEIAKKLYPNDYNKYMQEILNNKKYNSVGDYFNYIKFKTRY